MRRYLSAVIGLVVATSLSVSPTLASTWSDPGFQWRTRQPFTLNVDDHTTGGWPARVALAAADWSASSTADVVVGGKGGKVKVSIYNYAGPATSPCAWMQVSFTGGYIKSAGITINDTCMDVQADWFKQYAVCQELGHALGMPDHRTDVPTLPSCMSPQRPGEHPSLDDFDKLASLYP